jgi:hypothetical protein
MLKDQRGASTKKSAAAVLSTAQKKARTEPADHRCDYNGGKERNELGAHKKWIESDPQRRGNHYGHESEGVGAASSRPQRGDIDVNGTQSFLDGLAHRDASL